MSILFAANYNNEENETRSMNQRERNDYECISTRNLDANHGSGCSRYPINDDEPTTYCTSQHPNINFFFFTSFYFIFLAFGAIIFMIIEQPGEVKSRDNIIRQQEAFLIKYPNVDTRDLNALLSAVLKAQNNGYYVPIVGSDLVLNSPVFAVRTKRSVPGKQSQQNQQTITTIHQIKDSHTQQLTQPSIDHNSYQLISETQTEKIPNELKDYLQQEVSRLTPIKYIYNWRLSSSLLFVTSLVTTIGYGNLTPLTTVGKIVCMLYSIVGVPATLVFLSTLVTIFARGPVKRVEGWIIKIILCLHRTAPLFALRIVHLIVITTILLCICFFIPAYVFYLMEDNWTYLDALYCCFISLTTIGLGDFVPAVDGFIADIIYPLAVVSYLLLGLSMIMLWLALIHRIPQFQLGDALVREDKEDEQLKEKENIRAKEKLRVLIDEIILHDKLKQVQSVASLQSIAIQEP